MEDPYMEHPHLILYRVSYELGNVCHTGADSSTTSIMGGNRAEREKKRRERQGQHHGTRAWVSSGCVSLSHPVFQQANFFTEQEILISPTYRPMILSFESPPGEIALELFKAHNTPCPSLSTQPPSPFRSIALLDAAPNEIALEIFKYLDRVPRPASASPAKSSTQFIPRFMGRLRCSTGFSWTGTNTCICSSCCMVG
jgi:hypothetical protein